LILQQLQEHYPIVTLTLESKLIQEEESVTERIAEELKRVYG
jgi:hypothetical protein